MNRSKTLQNQRLSVILTLVLLQHFDSLSSLSSIFLGIYKKNQSIVAHLFISRTEKVFLNNFALIS